MRTTLQKWGNSQGVRIPKAVLDELGMEVGDEVELVSDGGRLILRSTRGTRGKYRIEDLVKQMPRDSKQGEVYWGPRQGEEAC